MKNILIEGLIGFVMSVICSAAIAGLSAVTELGFGDCKYVVITGLFIGLPIGSVLGVLLTKKLILKEDFPFILRTIISLILGLGGVVLGFYLLDILGSQYLIIIPITVVILVLCGYHINSKSKPEY